MALLQIEHLHKRFGALAATDNLSLQINQGELHALIGPNGAGKTTLISLLSGSLQPDSGLIKFHGRNFLQVPETIRPRLGLVRSFQITSVFPEFSALENVNLPPEVLAQSTNCEFRHRFAYHKPRCFMSPCFKECLECSVLLSCRLPFICIHKVIHQLPPGRKIAF